MAAICFFSLSLLATKIYNYPLFVCCLFGYDNNVRLESLGCGNHVWLPESGTGLVWSPRLTRPKARELSMTVRPKLLEVFMASRRNLLGFNMKLKEFKIFYIFLILLYLKKKNIDPLHIPG